MSLKKQFPIDEGYVHARLTLCRTTALTDAQLRNLATGNRPEDYEIPFIVQRGSIVTAVTRHKDRKPTKSEAVHIW